MATYKIGTKVCLRSGLTGTITKVLLDHSIGGNPQKDFIGIFSTHQF